MTKKQTKKKPDAGGAAVRFTPGQLAASKRYKPNRDIIMAALDEGKTYTLGEADKAVRAYLEKEVK